VVQALGRLGLHRPGADHEDLAVLRDNRVARAREAMVVAGLDALLVWKNENVRYQEAVLDPKPADTPFTGIGLEVELHARAKHGQVALGIGAEVRRRWAIGSPSFVPKKRLSDVSYVPFTIGSCGL